MWTLRAAMATTNLEAEMDSANGFAGRGSVAGSSEGCFEGWWMWRVESQDAEISMSFAES